MEVWIMTEFLPVGKDEYIIAVSPLAQMKGDGYG